MAHPDTLAELGAQPHVRELIAASSDLTGSDLDLAVAALHAAALRDLAGTPGWKCLRAEILRGNDLRAALAFESFGLGPRYPRTSEEWSAELCRMAGLGG